MKSNEERVNVHNSIRYASLEMGVEQHKNSFEIGAE